MRILTRYVLREFIVPLFYCLSGFISIYVLFELFGSFSRLVDADMSFGMICSYFCAYLAPYFHYLAPAALMLATLYTMWMFCRHSELVAMRASGISLVSIAKPIISVAVLMAVFVVWVNEDYVPRRAQWATQMRNEKFDVKKIARADNVVYRNSKNGRTWNIDSLGDVEGRILNGVKVTVDRPGGSRLMNINAQKAEYLDGEWWFSGVQVSHYNSAGQEIATPSPQLDALPLRCFPEFKERPDDFMMQNRPWRFNSVRDRFRYIRNHRELTDKAKNDCRYDAWAQLMAPLSCIVITLFAIPAGIATGRQSVFRGILGALGMYFAFYGITIGFMVVAKNGWCPPIPAAVIPVALFFVLAVKSFHKQR
jgi:lipopolysaccharide export system permease protein